MSKLTYYIQVPHPGSNRRRETNSQRYIDQRQRTLQKWSGFAIVQHQRSIWFTLPLPPCLDRLRAQLCVLNRWSQFGMLCLSPWSHPTDMHAQTVIEVDGNNVEPVTVDSIQIYAGQRYSFILNADKPIGNYWIRAQPSEGDLGFDNGLNSAILHYNSAPNSDPTTSQGSSTNLLRETDLHPLENPAAPGKPDQGGADVPINLEIGIVQTPAVHFTVNGASFTAPTAPVLLQILSGASVAQDLLPLGSVYPLPTNKVIELSIPGFATGGPVSLASIFLFAAF